LPQPLRDLNVELARFEVRRQCSEDRVKCMVCKEAVHLDATMNMPLAHLFLMQVGGDCIAGVEHDGPDWTDLEIMAEMDAETAARANAKPDVASP
jgi:hypothetical protein